MRGFEEFLDREVKKQHSDLARAKSLVKSAEDRFIFIKTLPLNNKQARYIVENVYDVIREFIEARLYLDGYNSRSHEATVLYLKKLGFSLNDIVFVDELRKIRNGIKYYGKESNLEYAIKVLDLIN